MVKKALDDEKQAEPVTPGRIVTHSPEEADLDILDWDFRAEPPPPRAHGTIRVRLKYLGRSKPIPVEDPDLE